MHIHHLRKTRQKLLDLYQWVSKKPFSRIKIGKKYIGHGEPVFIIAEIGLNHNGFLERAKKLIEAAQGAGVDCVKFQMRDLKTLYKNAGKSDDIRENLGSQYVLDQLEHYDLSDEEMYKLFDYVQELGMVALCTPWDSTSLKKLEAYGMDSYKVASADLTNHDLLRSIVATGKPLIVSTGMADEKEIKETNKLLRDAHAKYILLHCNSTYPAPFEDINLQYMTRLGSLIYGYSGHERGYHVPISAVTLGAKIIEKHITLDRSLPGTDHKVSLLPEEFKEMVDRIRETEAALIFREHRTMSQGERINRSTLAKSLIARRDIQRGEVISESMLDVKSPGQGVQPNRKKDLIGRKAKRTMKAGDFFYQRDLTDTEVRRRNYSFSRPFGIPVRYHDYQAMMENTNPDFLEFHLSFKDMNEDITRFFHKEYDLGLVIHSPETFAHDHLLDFASEDDTYWNQSITYLQEVIDKTRLIKKHFKKANKVFIVTNLGGFTRDNFVKEGDKDKMYKRVAEGLKKLDTQGVEIIAQTMPPFPWLLGGQLYHNLFMSPSEIRAFYDSYGLRICLDTSHTFLACNYFGWNFSDVIRELGKTIAYLHIVDAAGTGGEGLQIEEGEIDFKQLGGVLKEVAPGAGFIPEIWQGHENQGEGFWIALERLEKYL